MFDLKVIHSVLSQLEEERGIPREKVMEAIEMALATAYKKEYGKRGQIVRATFDINSGKTDFLQVKLVVDPSQVIMEDEEEKENEERIRFNPENNNLQTFVQKCAKQYNLSNLQIKRIVEIIELNKRHQQSALEFVKRDRVVILSDSLSTQTLDIHLIKQYLLLAKELIMKTNQKMS